MHRPAALLVLVPALLLAGCPGGGGGGGASAVASFKQRLELQVDGKTVEVPLERLDIYLVEDESVAESFQLRGPGVHLGGELPVHVGYGDAWERLVGKPVEVAAEGGDPRAPEKSRITLPGTADAAPTRGTFTVRKVHAGFDAKTPLEGDVELRLDDGRTLQGKLFVLATTWG